MKVAIQLSRLESTIFYDLDKAIKSYRQYAQKNIRDHQLNITIDQWLILKSINDNPSLTQKEIAKMVFKDYASVTRIIELLVKGDYIRRSFHDTDRRRYKLELTHKGKEVHKKLVPIVYSNRKNALNGITQEEINQLRNILRKLFENCKQ